MLRQVDVVLNQQKKEATEKLAKRNTVNDATKLSPKIQLPKIYMPEINNNNYNIWSKQLSQAWDYDYRKQPIVAWLQLNSILAHNWNRSGHFPDEGALGTHPTYPGLGVGVKIIRYIKINI